MLTKKLKRTAGNAFWIYTAWTVVRGFLELFADIVDYFMRKRRARRS